MAKKKVTKKATKKAVNKGQKKWYQSKTLWLNALAIIAGLASYAQGEIAIGNTLTIGGAANALLRVISNKEIVR